MSRKEDFNFRILIGIDKFTLQQFQNNIHIIEGF